jgi:hypothetical protein
MSFNPTIDIGDVVKFVSLLLGAFWFVSKMSGRLDMVTAEIKALENIVKGQTTELAEFSKALLQLARQDERLNAMDRRLEDLSKGRGWQREVEGEYMRTGKVQS